MKPIESMGDIWMRFLELRDSRIDEISLFGRKFYIKRDDLLESRFNGNKARKFYKFLVDDLFDIEEIVSYGGAQSNAMYALSNLAQLKNKKFTYYAKTLASYLRENIEGNLKNALENGMNLIELNSCEYDIFLESFKSGEFAKKLYIKQGGAEKFAKLGMEILAEELNHDIDSLNLKNPAVVISSGTGVSALYLSKFLKYDLFTTNSIGDMEYLKKQMLEIEDYDIGTIGFLATQKKYHFGNLYRELYEIYLETKRAGIEFDLLYDCKMWQALLENLEIFEGRDIVFIHTGGVNGNITQLKRYSFKEYFVI